MSAQGRAGDAAPERAGPGSALAVAAAGGALIAVPAVFNTYSFSGFELDKSSLLQVLALAIVFSGVLGLAWARAPARIGLASVARDAPAARAIVAAVVSLTIAYAAAHAIATVVSISPALSLLGSVERGHGIGAVLALATVCLALVACLRTRDAIERVITAIAIGSAPIALYGLVQHAELDPLTWSFQSRSPVRSTMGNEIFVSAYLLMVVPLTAYRLLRCVEASLATPAGCTASACLPGLAVAVGVQALAWWHSLLAGSVAVVLVPALARALARGRISVDGALAAGGWTALLSAQIACLLATQSRGPFVGLAAAVLILSVGAAVLCGRRRLAHACVLLAALAVLALALRDVPGSPFRALAEVPGLARLTGVFKTSGSAQVRRLMWDGGARAIAAAPISRLALGYGPETERFAFFGHYPAGLASAAGAAFRIDRAHNESIDLVLRAGMAGLVAWWALLGVAATAALRLAGGRGNAVDVLAWGLGGALLAGLAARAASGAWTLAWVAGPLGAVGALTLFLALRWRPRTVGPGDVAERMLPLALLAALGGHVVESHVGIATVSTRLLLFACIGLLGALVLTETRAPRAGARRQNAGVPGLPMVALVFWTIGYDFARTRGTIFFEPGLVWLLVSTVVLLIAIGAGRSVSTDEEVGRSAGAVERASLVAAIALVVTALSGILFSDRTLAGVPGERAVLAYHLGIAALVVWAAHGARRSPRPGAARLGACAVALLACVSLAWWCALRPTLADVAFSRGRALELDPAGDREDAIDLYARALERAPSRVPYLVQLADALSGRAESLAEARARADAFGAARDALLRARASAPLDPLPVLNLGRLELVVARDRPGGQAGHLRSAEAYFAEAVALAPGMPVGWNEWGRAARLMGAPTAALERHLRARALDPGLAETHAHLGDAHVVRADWQRAAEAFREAVRLDPGWAAARASLARSLERLGDVGEALAQLREALRLAPHDQRVRHELVRMAAAAGDCDQAVASALEGMVLAPADPLVRDAGVLASACASPERGARD